MSHGGQDGRGHGRGQNPPYCAICGENAGHITKDFQYTKTAKELKQKDKASRNSEAPEHIFHNTLYADSTSSRYYSLQFFLAGAGGLQQQSYHQGYMHPPLPWYHTSFPHQQQYGQYPTHLAVVSSPALPEQQQSSQPNQAKPEKTHDQNVVINILPSRGHIFAITGRSNQEHESKRARRDYERRVHTISPRLPLNMPAWSLIPITFDESDFQVTDYPHSDAFIATANVAGYMLHNILVDTGSSADILFVKAFDHMGLDRRTLEPAGNSLYGFGGKKIDAIGKKAIPVSFEEGERVRTETITFDIVNMDYPYTAIFGRGFINRFEAIIKQSYLCMKMPSPFGVITVHGDQVAARRTEGRPISGYCLINEVAKKVEEDKS